MPKTITGFGIGLIVLGVGAYVAAGFESVTAMIPAFFGVPILACGLLAAKPGVRTGATIGAILFGLLGLGGSLSRVLPGLFRGEGVQMNLATGVQIAMAAMCAVLVGSCVGALLKSRKGQAAAG